MREFEIIKDEDGIRSWFRVVFTRDRGRGVFGDLDAFLLILMILEYLEFILKWLWW